MADPSALQTAVAAAEACSLLGLPEARLSLAHATIHLSLSPKSNAVIVAIDEAIADVRKGSIGTVPPHLRDGHYPGASAQGHGVGYHYPHDSSEGIVEQAYAPEPVAQRDYYRPTTHGAEARWGDINDRIRRVLRGEAAVRDPLGSENAPEGS
jgi:putative ATPase